MKNAVKIGVIGGDRRTVEIIRCLKLSEFDVSVWGIDPQYIDNSLLKENCETAVLDAEKCTFDGENGVEVYPVEDQPFVMSELLSAFAELWKS